MSTKSEKIEKTQITMLVSKEHKKKLKQIALNQDMTISSLMEKLIDREYEKEVTN